MNASAITDIYSGQKAKIIKYLGAGIEPSKVAAAVGVDPSYISQLLADDDFRSQVTVLRFEKLEEATNRDSRLNTIEDKLIDKTEKLIDNPLSFTKPMETIKALQMVNGMKRRGAEVTDAGAAASPVVTLTLPASMLAKFTVDINNQVIKADDQTLVTLPSGSMERLINEANENSIDSLQQITENKLNAKLTHTSIGDLL